MKKLLTADEVAELLSVDRSTIYRWVDAGGMPAFRLAPGTLRFDLDMVDDWLSGRLVGGPRPAKPLPHTSTGRVQRLRAAVSSKVQAASVAAQE